MILIFWLAILFPPCSNTLGRAFRIFNFTRPGLLGLSSDWQTWSAGITRWRRQPPASTLIAAQTARKQRRNSRNVKIVLKNPCDCKDYFRLSARHCLAFPRSRAKAALLPFQRSLFKSPCPLFAAHGRFSAGDRGGKKPLPALKTGAKNTRRQHCPRVCVSKA